MSRPQQQRSVKPARSRHEADRPISSPPRDWTRWRPRRPVALLYLSAVLLLAWIGFLLLMIRRN
jgi:hypothetical protein